MRRALFYDLKYFFGRKLLKIQSLYLKYYNTTATASGYKVTATSGSSTQDWTSSYKPIQATRRHDREELGWRA